MYSAIASGCAIPVSSTTRRKPCSRAVSSSAREQPPGVAAAAVLGAHEHPLHLDRVVAVPAQAGAADRGGADVGDQEGAQRGRELRRVDRRLVADRRTAGRTPAAPRRPATCARSESNGTASSTTSSSSTAEGAPRQVGHLGLRRRDQPARLRHQVAVGGHPDGHLARVAEDAHPQTHRARPAAPRRSAAPAASRPGSTGSRRSRDVGDDGRRLRPQDAYGEPVRPRRQRPDHREDRERRRRLRAALDPAPSARAPPGPGPAGRPSATGSLTNTMPNRLPSVAGTGSSARPQVDRDEDPQVVRAPRRGRRGAVAARRRSPRAARR